MLFDNVYIEQKQNNGDILLVKKNLYIDEYICKRQPNGDILLKKVTIIDPDDIYKYDFKGSKIQHVRFNRSSELLKPGFKKLYEEVHKQIGDGVQIIRHSVLSIKTIEYTTKGYCWYPDLGISIQGVDANKALKETVTQCRQNDINLEITILIDDRLIKIYV